MLPRLKSKLAALMRSRELALLAATAAFIRLYWIVIRDRPGIVSLDFSSFYLWAWLLRNHLDPYHVTLRPYADSLHLYIGAIYRADYPPTFLLLFEPLTWLSPWTAYWIWCGASVVLLLASLVLLVPARKLSSQPAALILMSLAIIYRPIQTHFVYLQFQIPILFLLILMWRSLHRGDDRAAGAWLALAGLLKVYPLFMMLYLVCMRKWRALAFCVILIAAGFVLTVMIVGSPSFGFFETVGRHIAPNAGVPEVPKIGIADSIVRWYRHFDPDDSNRALVIVRTAAEVILELTLLGITALAIVRSRTNPLRAEYAFGLCVAAMVLCYNSWTHYMVLLLFPLSQIAIAAETGIAPAAAPILALIGYVLVEVSYQAAHKSFRHGHENLGFWLAEGIFVSTLIAYAAAYVLTTGEERRPTAPCS